MSCPHKLLSKEDQLNYLCPRCLKCFCLHGHQERADGWYTKCKHGMWRRCIPESAATK